MALLPIITSPNPLSAISETRRASRTVSIILLGLCLCAIGPACKRAPAATSLAEIANERPEAAPSLEVTTPSEKAGEKTAVPEWVAKKYQYNPSRTLHWDLLHTKIEISFNWKLRQAPAVATLQLTPWFYPQDSLVLDAVGFDVNSVKLLDGGKKRKLTFAYDSTHLRISLPQAYKKGERISVEIDYVAKPETVKERGSAAITSDKGLYFINPDGTDPEKPRQIWTQGETQASSHWFPTIDSPNERCTQEMHITVDTAFTTLSNGLLSYSVINKDGTRTDVWEMKQPHAPYLFMMAIGKFVIHKDKWRKLEVNTYMEPKYAHKAKTLFGRTPQMMEYFSKLLGVDYPWPKYHQVVVRDYVSGAMENTSASLFQEALQTTDKHLNDESWDDIVAHELFHQWFGDLVTCESWPNLPLNESFATYGELLWKEHQAGQDGLQEVRLEKMSDYLNEAGSKQEPMIRYFVRDKEDMFDSHSYAKGGLILHMLRSTVGDEAFFASLQLYLTRNKYKAVEIHDLRLAFEEVTGQDLNWFFNQWFLSAGHPRLMVQHNIEGNRVSLNVNQQQDTLYTPIYRLPVKVDFLMADGSTQRRSIVVDKVSQDYEWNLSGAVQAISFDADASLLATVAHSHTKEQYLAQLKFKLPLQTRLRALNRLQQNLNEPEVEAAIVAALKDPYYLVRSNAIAILLEDSVVRPRHLATAYQLAMNDPHRQVKARVLSLLDAKNTEQLAILKRYTTDESPLLRSTAVGAILDADGPEALALADKLDADPDGDVQVKIMNLLANKGDEASYDRMLKKLDGLTGSNRFYGYNALGKYLLNCAACQGKGIKFLKEKVESSDPITKLGAFQGLAMFLEQPGIMELLKAKKTAETNGQIRQYMELMLPD